jgi:hypothetical protein
MSEQESGGQSIDLDPEKGAGGFREPAAGSKEGTPRGPLPEAGREDQGQPPPPQPGQTLGEDSPPTTGSPTGTR